ncbi:uncharacterized protein LODBEIA_P24240 [Lodderomyces beijingensis]|uniref:mRNA export factor GLE1 n=1 Tax=Lodderomyces beijingensis TaxID=1775926 RepID=A0ABP0ZJ85_9ASCO
MRFAFPEECEVELMSEPVTTLTRHPARVVSIDPVVPRVLPNTNYDEISFVYEAINDYTTIWIEQKANEARLRRSHTEESVKTTNELSKVNIWKLSEQLQSRLTLQASRVKSVIETEKTRLRLEAEARQRSLDEEKARIKRLEEEKQRVEEEKERQRLEAEKRRRDEQEQERIRKEAEKLKQEQEQKRKAAEAAELKEKQEQAKKKQEAAQAQKAALSTNFNSIEKQFLKYKQDIEDIKQNVKNAIDQNKDLKKSVNAYKRKINPKFGQLSNSASHTNFIIREVVELVEPVQRENGLPYKWILNFMAKAIVDQAESEVSIRPDAATPLATLAFTLLLKFPEFEYFLAARFVKKCPYIIGFTDPMTTVEGRARMNWKRIGENEWENEVKYDERVAGICTVWAVMTRLSDEGIGIFSDNSSWQFVARTLNTPLSLIKNTHFELLANWWEATAASFLETFGKQAVKVMQLMVVRFVDAVADRKYPSAARLRILGEDWAGKGEIQTLKEMES